jgi:hypothetical protein
MMGTIYGAFAIRIFRHAEGPMLSSRSLNPQTEHDLFLHLFLTNAGGW